MKRSLIIVAMSALVVCLTGYTLSFTGNEIVSSSSAHAAEVVNVLEDSESSTEEMQILDSAELMKLLVDPTFESLKDAIENPPVKRKEWRMLYIAAFNLAEINNLNFSRTGKDYMETEEWTDFVAMARTNAIDLAETVRTRPEYDVMKDKFITVMENCNDCHVKFSADEEIDEVIPPASWEE